MPEAVVLDAYSHEVSSDRVLAGRAGGRLPGLLFLCLAIAAQLRCRADPPGEAVWNPGLNQHLLPYDAVRTAADPAAHADGIPDQHL